MSNHILYLQSNEAIAENFKVRFDERGIEMKVATSGEEAFKMLKKGKYDLFLVDIHIPDMRIGELVRKVSRDFPSIIINVCVDVLKAVTITKLINRYAIHKIYVAPWDVEEMVGEIEESIEHAHIVADKKKQENAIYREKEEFTTTLQTLTAALKRQQHSYGKLKTVSDAMFEGITGITKQSTAKDIEAYFQIKNAYDTYLKFQTTGSLDTPKLEGYIMNDLKGIASEKPHFSIGDISSCLTGEIKRVKLSNIRYAVYLSAILGRDTFKTCRINVSSSLEYGTIGRFKVSLKGERTDNYKDMQELYKVLFSEVSDRFTIEDNEEGILLILDYEVRSV